MSFEIAMQALTADAGKWDATADMLATAASAAGGLVASEAEFSFAGGDVAAAYESTRAFVQDYLSKGAKEAGGAADALRAVRAAYEGSDTSASNEVMSKWEPVS